MTIPSLNPATPAGNEPVSFGDEEIRDLKLSLKQSFPQFESTPMTLTAAQVAEAYNKHNDIGIIRMWSGSEGDIPEGFAISDGRTVTDILGREIVTPDFTSKFIKMAGTNNPYNPVVTGTDDIVMVDEGHALTVDEMPPHSHSYTLPAATNDDEGSSDTVPNDDYTTGETDLAGGGEAHFHPDITVTAQPEYYTLVFIMWIGKTNRQPQSTDGFWNFDRTAPAGEDYVSNGDDDLRTSKQQLQDSFPRFTGGAVNLTESELMSFYHSSDQVGQVCLWAGDPSTIPAGWQLFEQYEGLYVKAADGFAEVGVPSGSSEQTPVSSATGLTSIHLPEHSHTMFARTGDSGRDNANPDGSRVLDEEDDDVLTTGSTGNGVGHTHPYAPCNVEPAHIVIPFVEYVGL
ncbi:hypothetical protein AB4331_05960 [Vibrio breoganii]